MTDLIIPGQYRPLSHRVEWQFGYDLSTYKMDFPNEDDAIRYAARLHLIHGYRAIHCIIAGQTKKITRADIAQAQTEARRDGPVGRYGYDDGAAR